MSTDPQPADPVLDAKQRRVLRAVLLLVVLAVFWYLFPPISASVFWLVVVAVFGLVDL